MNAQAAAVEHGMGRAVMSSFHGLFSLGGVVGAVLAGGAMLAGANDAQHVAAAGFGAFSLVMAAGRFAGDGLVDRFGARLLLRASGALAAVGLGSALAIGGSLSGVVGFGLVGLGIANIVPVLFGAAARTPGIAAGRALSAVATTGYLGFLAGPPLIGAVAEVVGLTVGLALVSAACALIAA